jgi:putative FmdB family regulatory protein
MPTYVYRCEQGHTFEVFHGISDDSPRRCPECDSPAKRVPAGGAGLLFKGSGFYITDYRSKGYKESAKKEGGSSDVKSAPTSSPGAQSAPADKPAPASSPGAQSPGGSTSSGGSTSTKPGSGGAGEKRPTKPEKS